MNAIIYNLCMTLGVVLAVVGVGLLHGVAVALIVAGALMIGLTMFGAWMTTRG
ncbi:hypothetical protein PPMP20_18945 [Paraburkholderia phymatum]|uniref:Uncharacterized protein n=1 Tax=Paraburkholderia phymatum (strain DSM 17167 / CIP 108236 / LMG 21445 / STM815) TaxID=391038 RepID=B2JU89_PARP8|nr:hypothetical protein [Paraburkholderia phymatum]ACC76142.1 hypothetical protein Bphy_7141 [Paraburkholderia phymatum STM815]